MASLETHLTETGEAFVVTRVLSVRDSTLLVIEHAELPGLMRVRVENADMQMTVVLTRDEATWMRDVLVDAIALLPRSEEN